MATEIITQLTEWELTHLERLVKAIIESPTITVSDLSRHVSVVLQNRRAKNPRHRKVTFKPRPLAWPATFNGFMVELPDGRALLLSGHILTQGESPDEVMGLVQPRSDEDLVIGFVPAAAVGGVLPERVFGLGENPIPTQGLWAVAWNRRVVRRRRRNRKPVKTGQPRLVLAGTGCPGSGLSVSGFTAPSRGTCVACSAEVISEDGVAAEHVDMRTARQRFSMADVILGPRKVCSGSGQSTRIS